MGWSNPFLFELTIPSGAGTGARIEINKNNNGRIDIYNSSNQLVDSLGGPLGKVVIGIVGAVTGHFEFDPNVGTFSGYDQTGLSRFEMESASGTIRVINADGYQVLFLGTDGNDGAIQQSNADASKTLQAQVGSPRGDLVIYFATEEATSSRWASFTLPAPGTLQINSGGSAASPTVARTWLRSGTAGSVTGSASCPHMQVISAGGGTDVDLLLSGNIIGTSPGGTRHTWLAPTFATGWAEYNGGAYPPLRWRYDAQDNIHITGCFTVVSLPAPNVLATGFPDAIGADVTVCGAMLKIAGPGTGLDVITSYVDNAGGLRMSNVGGVAVGDYFMINAVVPLRHI